MRDVNTASHIIGRNRDKRSQLLTTLSGVERVGPGAWRSANISKISENNHTKLSPIKSSRRRPRLEKKRQLDPKLELVEDLFVSLHHQKKLDNLRKNKIQQSNEIGSRTENQVDSVDKDPISGSTVVSLPFRLKKTVDISLLSLLKIESPEKQKRMNSASLAYNESIVHKQNKKALTRLLPEIYAKAWEHSIKSRKQKELETLKKKSGFHQKDYPKKSKKRRKKKQHCKDSRQEEFNEDLLQLLLHFEKWLHRTFLKVKDACITMHNEFTLNELTNLIVNLGIPMKRDHILIVLNLIIGDVGDKNNQEDEIKLTLHKLETGIRRSKINRRF